MPLHQPPIHPPSDLDLRRNLQRISTGAERQKLFFRAPRTHPVYDDSPPTELVEFAEAETKLPGTTPQQQSIFQPNAAPKPLPGPPKPPAPQRPTVSQSQLEKCRLALRTTFRQCNAVEFQLVGCAMSCILNSTRPLLREEILAAPVILDYKSAQKAAPAVKPNLLPHARDWLRRCDEILTEDFEGRITFRSKAMAFFLHKFPIHGIDVSHRTIATVCLRQREIVEDLARLAPHVRDNSGVLRAAEIFSKYAETSGSLHVRAASLKNLMPLSENDLDRHTRRVHSSHLKSEHIESNPMRRPSTASTTSESCLSDADDDTHDWVMVDDASTVIAESWVES